MENATAQLISRAEILAPNVAASVAQIKLLGPMDRVLRSSDCYRLDLCLAPRSRNARACFDEHWAPKRFEPLGNLFLVPPGESIRAKGDGGSLFTAVICELPAELVARHGDIRWTPRRLEASLDIKSKLASSLMIRLAYEVCHPGFASMARTEGLAEQLADEIGRYYGELDELPVTSGLSHWRLRLIDDRLNEMVAAPTVNELAELCRLSVRQLSRAFRVSRGCSIGDYVARRQMEHAKRLLLEGYSTKYTALTLGFSSGSNFCYAFRRASGMSPSLYLQRVRRG